jgi:hypothetical protein
VNLLLITGNPQLATCEAEWLRDHIGVENIADSFHIGENDDDGTCAP